MNNMMDGRQRYARGMMVLMMNPYEKATSGLFFVQRMTLSGGSDHLLP
jgi:hypothetical protein